MVHENKHIIKRDFVCTLFEYIFIFFVILECNSFFDHSLNNNDGVFLGSFLVYVIPATAIIILSLHMFFDKKHIFRELFFPLFVYYVLSITFFYVNVRSLVPLACRDYIIRFFVFLPLMICLFRYTRSIGKPFSFWFCHANILYYFSFLNLILFFIISISPDSLFADPIYTRWGSNGELLTRYNFYNICVININTYREMFGLKFFRNFGVFPEPLMFCVQLIPALSTELFLYEAGKTRWIRCLVLTLAIFTTQSDLGMMLLLLIWGIRILSYLSLKSKKRYFIPIIAIISIGIFYIYFRKSILYGTSETSSISLHLQDYVACFKAFLQHPFIGNGYSDESIIRVLLPSHRIEAEAFGLSNSIGLIFAEGGLLLGCICTFPFLFGFLLVFQKEYRSIAFWTVGAFCLYVVTIFHYHMFLLMFLAFGWSLLDLYWRPRNIPSHNYSTSEDHPSYPVSNMNHKGKKVWQYMAFLSLIFLSIIVICIVIPLPEFLFSFLNSHRFLLGQSVWKTTGFLLAVLFVVLFQKHVINIYRISSIKRKLLCYLFPIGFSLCFLIAYPSLYTKTHTLLMVLSLYREPLETLLLFGLFLISFIFVWIILCHYKRLIKKSVYCVIIALIVIGAGLYGRQQLRYRLYVSSHSIPEADLEAISTIVSLPESRLYADEDAWLYQILFPEVHSTAAKGRGFAHYVNTSVLFPVDSDIPELFNTGFQITAISDQTLLYSNDHDVIASLSDKGYKFCRYFPYAHHIDLDSIALMNGLPFSEAGFPLVGGSGKSIEHTPPETLDAGTYTATFKLHLISNNEIIGKDYCSLQICCSNGKKIVRTVELSSSDFATSENAVIDVVFTIPFSEGVEYRVIAETDIQLELLSLTIRHSPSHLTLTTRNSLGLPLLEKHFNPDGSILIMPEGYSSKASVYDNLGRLIMVTYGDDTGQPVMISGGYAQIRYERNYQGKITKESYFDNKGLPVMLPEHYAVIVSDYGSAGVQLVSQRYLDTNQAPVQCTAGFAEKRCEYNEKGQLTRENYYDTDGSPAFCLDGYASISYEYDDAGNATLLRYYDEDGHPVILPEGYAELHKVFNSVHKCILQEYYDVDGFPLIMPGGYFATEYVYDAAGYCSYIWYYDTEKRLALIWNSYAGLHRIYNEKSQIIREEYFGIDRNPILRIDGYAADEREFDSAGNIVVQRFYDLSNQLTVCSGGYAEIHRTYNAQKKIVHEEFYGPDGQLVLLPQGYAVSEYIYNATGDLIQQLYYDTNGRPVNIV